MGFAAHDCGGGEQAGGFCSENGYIFHARVTEVKNFDVRDLEQDLGLISVCRVYI